jgi:hypothetical protein
MNCHLLNEKTQHAATSSEPPNNANLNSAAFFQQQENGMPNYAARIAAT